MRVIILRTKSLQSPVSLYQYKPPTAVNDNYSYTRILVQIRYTRSTYYTNEHIGCRFHEIMFVLAGSTFLFVRVKDIYMSYSEKNGKRRRENYGSNWKTPTRYIIYLVRIIARTLKTRFCCFFSPPFLRITYYV